MDEPGSGSTRLTAAAIRKRGQTSSCDIQHCATDSALLAYVTHDVIGAQFVKESVWR